MKDKQFLQFLVMAVCLKFIFSFAITSCLLAAVLGCKNDTYIQVKSVILGVILGIESAFIIFLFRGNLGLSIMLGVFRSLGLPVADSLSYSTVIFLSFAYIVVFEILLVAIFSRIGQLIQKQFEKTHLHIAW